MAINPNPLTPPAGTPAAPAPAATPVNPAPAGPAAVVNVNNNNGGGRWRWLLGILLIAAIVGISGWYYYDRQKDIDHKINVVDKKADNAQNTADIANGKADETAGLLNEQAGIVDKAFGGEESTEIEKPVKPEISISSSYSDNVAAIKKRLASQKHKLQTNKFRRTVTQPEPSSVPHQIVQKFKPKTGVDITVKIDLDKLEAERQRWAASIPSMTPKSPNLPQ